MELGFTHVELSRKKVLDTPGLWLCPGPSLAASCETGRPWEAPFLPRSMELDWDAALTLGDNLSSILVGLHVWATENFLAKKHCWK